MTVVRKIIETTVDLFKSVDIYAADVKKMITEKLIQRYVGKCFQSMLIQSITNIIRYSDTYLVDNRLDGAAYIDVQFEAEGLVFVKGEVLHGCKVVDITTTGVIVSHKYAGGLLQSDPKKQVIKIIKKDQLIPVIIQAARYTPNQNQITIRGIPYVTMDPSNVFYNITEVLSPADTDKVDALLAELSEEMKLHSGMTSKSYEFFKELVYPYKTTQKFESSKLSEQFSKVGTELKSILEINSGCIMSPVETYKSSGLSLYHSKKSAGASYGLVIDSPLYPAILEIITKRLMYLRDLRGFAEQYDAQEKIQENMIYWKVCQSLKV